MPTTYTLISSNVLSSSALIVTLSSIPQTYTDLLIRYSARSDTSGTFRTLTGYFNSPDTTSWTQMLGDGSTATSSRSNSTKFTAGIINAGTSTANVFSSGELYIPNYTSSTRQKQLNSECFSEQNSAIANLNKNAILWQNTSAITSVSFEVNIGTFAFETGSSFYLYGIKNS